MRKYFWVAVQILAILLAGSLALLHFRHREVLPVDAQTRLSQALARGGMRSATDPTQQYADSEAYDVYSTIIPSIGRDPEMHMWLIDIKTTIPPGQGGVENYPELQKQLGQGEGTALHDFTMVNSKRWILQRKFDLPERYELVTEDQMRILFPDNGLFRGHWIQLSAVGFNTDKTMALVYIWDWCSIYCCCGTSSFQVLQRQRGGKWQVTGGAPGPVS